MRIRHLGLEWGAAYGEAHPTLISSSFEIGDNAPNGQILVYEREGGGLVVEIPFSAQLNLCFTTLAEHDAKSKETVLCIEVDEPFDYVPAKR